MHFHLAGRYPGALWHTMHFHLAGRYLGALWHTMHFHLVGRYPGALWHTMHFTWRAGTQGLSGTQCTFTGTQGLSGTQCTFTWRAGTQGLSGTQCTFTWRAHSVCVCVCVLFTSSIMTRLHENTVQWCVLTLQELMRQQETCSCANPPAVVGCSD